MSPGGLVTVGCWWQPGLGRQGEEMATRGWRETLPEEAARPTEASGRRRWRRQPVRAARKGGHQGQKERPRFFSPLISVGSVLPEARRQPLTRSLPANHLGLAVGGEGSRVSVRGHTEDLQHPISLKHQAAWQKSVLKFSWVYDT